MRLNVFNLVNNKEHAQPWRSGILLVEFPIQLLVSPALWAVLHLPHDVAVVWRYWRSQHFP